MPSGFSRKSSRNLSTWDSYILCAFVCGHTLEARILVTGVEFPPLKLDKARNAPSLSRQFYHAIGQRPCACDSATRSSGSLSCTCSRCLDNNKQSPPVGCVFQYRHRIQAQKQPYSYKMSSRRESEFARLEQLLREADERAEQERRRAEGERRRAEEADECAEQERRCAEDEQRNRREAESRAQIEGRKTRPTTFEEYIRACHTLLSKTLCIQTDKSLSI